MRLRHVFGQLLVGEIDFGAAFGEFVDLDRHQRVVVLRRGRGPGEDQAARGIDLEVLADVFDHRAVGLVHVDAVAAADYGLGLRFAARVNGLTELAVTKLDVLSMLESIPVCTAYRLADGTVTTDFPAHQSDFHHATPVYRELDGWGTDISSVTTYARLPAAARAYLELVESEVGVPIAIVSTSPDRDHTILLHHPFLAD